MRCRVCNGWMILPDKDSTICKPCADHIDREADEYCQQHEIEVQIAASRK